MAKSAANTGTALDTRGEAPASSYLQQYLSRNGKKRELQQSARRQDPYGSDEDGVDATGAEVASATPPDTFDRIDAKRERHAALTDGASWGVRSYPLSRSLSGRSGDVADLQQVTTTSSRTPQNTSGWSQTRALAADGDTIRDSAQQNATEAPTISDDDAIRSTLRVCDEAHVCSTTKSRRPRSESNARPWGTVDTHVGMSYRQRGALGFSPREEHDGGERGHQPNMGTQRAGARRGTHMLDTRESSALFWEEFASLEAKSSEPFDRKSFAATRHSSQPPPARRSGEATVTRLGRSRSTSPTRAARKTGVEAPSEGQNGLFHDPATLSGETSRLFPAYPSDGWSKLLTKPWCSLSRVDAPRTRQAPLASRDGEERECQPRPLGLALRTAGGLAANGTRMSAVGKHVTSLSGVPPNISRRASHLFVSNNNICSLEGLQHFSSVIAVSLAHNLVRRTHQLRPLEFLPCLKTLSLVGNPVCAAPNYRAHAISLTSACLKALDEREVTPLEKTEAPDIVAGQRSSAARILRQQRRCVILGHMLGLLENHAELRQALLLRHGNGALAAPRPWRQRTATRIPMHHVLTILQVERWPAFVQSELRAIDESVVDEAERLFAEVLVRRRAEGKRTQELSATARATLDSPSTRTWVTVLREIEQRVQEKEDHALASCEALRRRESVSFRQASGQVKAFVQDLSKRVGCSDDQWSIASPGTQPSVAGKGRAGASTGASRVPQERGRKGCGDAAMIPRGKCGDDVAAITAVSREAETQRPTEASLAEEERYGADYPRGGRAVTSARRGSNHGQRSPLLMTASMAPRRRPDSFNRQDDMAHSPCTADASAAGGARAVDDVIIGSCSPNRQTSCPDPQAPPLHPAPPPVVLRARGDSVLRSSYATRAPLPPPPPPMTSAASMLLSREACEPLSTLATAAASPQSLAQAGERAGPVVSSQTPSQMRSNCETSVGPVTPGGRRRPGEGPPTRDAAAEGGSAVSAEACVGQGVDRHEIPGPGHAEPSARHADTGGGGAHEPEWWSAQCASGGTPCFLAVKGANLRTRSALLQPPVPVQGSLGRRARAGGGVSWSPKTEARTVDSPRSDAFPVAENTARVMGFRGDIIGLSGVSGENEPRISDGGTSQDRQGCSEATEELLREVQRVKRWLESMNRADALAGDEDMEDDSPSRFLASVGLVDLKPLPAELVDRLDRSPKSGFASDVPVLAAQPRTTRALRDQVASLGKEVARRAEACADARRVYASLRRQVEAARRTRAKNLDRADAACRRLIADARQEAKVLCESRRVCEEAERYHDTLARLQEGIETAVAETREIVSASESAAQQLRAEMNDTGAQLIERKHVAEEGLADWERAAAEDPALGALRRAYDCEIIVLRHRAGIANRASRGAAFRRLRRQCAQQRRARKWVSAAETKREKRLVRAAFDALARGSRSRAAAEAAMAARCRAGLAAWRRSAEMARRAVIYRARRERERAVEGLRRWRQGAGLARWALGALEGEALEWRLESFRERRAKRIVFRAWREAIQAAPPQAPQTGEDRAVGARESRLGARRRRRVSAEDEFSSAARCRARVRTAEALARRRRLDTQTRLAFEWWHRQCQCSVLARTAGQRRGLKRWRQQAKDSSWMRAAAMEARGRFVVALGKRVMTAWSAAARARSRRRSGASAILLVLSAVLRRDALRRWKFLSAAAALERERAMIAFEHCYDGSLRLHLRAWSALVKDRRILRRGAELLARGRRVAVLAAGLWVWRRRCVLLRERVLRERRIKAGAAAAARRRRLTTLYTCFSAWATLRRRAAVVRSLARWAAARQDRLSLVRGFRALSLSGRRLGGTHRHHAGAAESSAADGGASSGEGQDAEAALESAGSSKILLDEQVRELRARLSQQRALALERRAEVSNLVVQIRRSERERASYAKKLERRRRGSPAATTAPSATSGSPTRAATASQENEGAAFTAISLGMSPSELTKREGEVFGRLQRETLEMRQRAAAAERAEVEMRSIATRKATAAKAAIEEALAEGAKRKEEADAREAARAKAETQARHAASQASALSARLAHAEQDLRFEATRNARAKRGKDEEIARLRAAAAAAERRLGIAEDRLGQEDREMEELRSRSAREGVVDGRDAKMAAKLQLRAFTAATDARLAADGCAAAAGERRGAATSAIAEALRAARSEADAAAAADRRAASYDLLTKENEKETDARKLVGESAAEERRELAELDMRRAEAKLRHSANLSHIADLERQSLPKREKAARAGKGNIDNKPGRASGGSRVGEEGSTIHLINPAKRTRTQGETRSNYAVTALGSSCGASSPPGREDTGASVDGSARPDDADAASALLLLAPVARAEEEEQSLPPAEGLQELRREIAHLECKILGRLGER